MGRKSRSSWAERPRAPIPFKLLDSPSFIALSAPAIRVFLRLIVEHGRHGGRDNGRLICTYRDFETYGASKDAIARAIRELVAVGLIEITRTGSAGNADQRRAAHYRITAFAAVDREGSDGTHDYEKITTAEEAKARVAAANAPVSKRDAANGRKATSATKNHNSAPENRGEAAPENRGETLKSPPPKTGVQHPPPKTGALSTYRAKGLFPKHARAGPRDRTR